MKRSRHESTAASGKINPSDDLGVSPWDGFEEDQVDEEVREEDGLVLGEEEREEEGNVVVGEKEEDENEEEVEEEEVVDEDQEAEEGGASGSGSDSGPVLKEKVKGEKQYVTYTEVPLPTPLPLDRSLYVPKGVMAPPYTEGMETMREFVCRVSVGMAATGLARCTLKLPSLADFASVEPESLLASKDLLEKSLGKAYKMRSYSCE